MTTSTEAVVRSTAISSIASSEASVFFNRTGNNLGADGRHAFPILHGYNYGWSNCHGSPNYNAIDIFASGGTPVVAVVSGRSEVAVTSLGGPVIFLFGDDGYNYYYAHLMDGSRVSGQVVAGEIIGEIASDTDLSSKNNGKAHVHFSIDNRTPPSHDGPTVPAGNFLNQVEPNSKSPCTI
jgi:murein DD-endopeptidase MepM/ murein hydrolase activator NlpD